MKIPVNKTYYDEKEKIYTYSQIELNPGVTVLIGCNGSGKTTLIKQIERYCNKKNIVSYKYDNKLQGDTNAMSKALFFNDMAAIASDFVSSEGERINNNIARCAPQIASAVRASAKSEEKVIFVLLDAIDSGLSIEGVMDTKMNLLHLIEEDAASLGVEAYIVVSANEYEMAADENCIDVTTGKYIKVKNYQDYKKIILNTYKKKCKRYKWTPSIPLD